MPTCTQAAPLTQRAMVSQGPALFVLGGGQLLRGRRLLDELAALSGVSGLWWRHVGGIAPKGGLALAHELVNSVPLAIQPTNACDLRHLAAHHIARLLPQLGRRVVLGVAHRERVRTRW